MSTLRNENGQLALPGMRISGAADDPAGKSKERNDVRTWTNDRKNGISWRGM